LSSSISSKLTSRCVRVCSRTEKKTRMCADEFWCKHMAHALMTCVYSSHVYICVGQICAVSVRKEGTTGVPYADPFVQTCAPSTISDKVMSCYFTMQRLRGT
jgi:hypothetical protein